MQFPRDEEGEPIFDELICKSCVPKCSFLSKYPDFVIAPSAVPDVPTDTVEIVEHANGAGSIFLIFFKVAAECSLQNQPLLGYNYFLPSTRFVMHNKCGL